MKKNSQALLAALKIYHSEYDYRNHYVGEVNLMHSANITNVGGEQAFNDSNTKVDIGISDFNGKQIPSDFKGLVNGIVVRYGKITKTGNPTAPSPGLIAYKELRSDFPSWALLSDLVIKAGGAEVIRLRIQELLAAQTSQEIPSEWCKDFLKTFKVIGGQDLELFISSPKGSQLSTDDYEYLQVTLYGIKFGSRTRM